MSYLCIPTLNHTCVHVRVHSNGPRTRPHARTRHPVHVTPVAAGRSRSARGRRTRLLVRTGTAAVRGGSTQPECTRRESAAASPLPAMPWWRSAQLPRVSCATTSIFVAVAAVASGAPAGRSSTAQHAGAAGAAAAAAAAAWPPTNASGWVGNTGRNAVLNATEPWESACVCEPQVVWEPDHSRYRM